MDVLSSRILLHPSDWERSFHFYRHVLGLKIYREWRGAAVFFLGGGFLELSGQGGEPVASTPQLWLQVEDLAAEHERLVAAGVAIHEAPVRKPWGLDEMRFSDPDGFRIVLIEVPPDHPLRTRTSK